MQSLYQINKVQIEEIQQKLVFWRSELRKYIVLGKLDLAAKVFDKINYLSSRQLDLEGL